LQKGLREGKVVTLDRWLKIDQAERQRAKDRGSKKEREKFTKVEDMLAVI
jgi:adrenodoxin-NADP+ reductase